MTQQEQLLVSRDIGTLGQPQVAAVPDETISMFERLARDPGVPVEKLAELVALQERVLARQAKAAFEVAFADMQSDLPIIAELGRTDKGTYARYEDIVKIVRPILKAHGFSLRFSTEWPETGGIRVTGILTHIGGHAERSTFHGDADKSGSKNEIQAQGSTTSYGRRYTTLDLLGIATERDDDAEAAGRKSQQKEPDGFADWLIDLGVVAEDGLKALEAAWEQSKSDYKRYLIASPGGKSRWEQMKRVAAKQSSGKG